MFGWAHFLSDLRSKGLFLPWLLRYGWSHSLTSVLKCGYLSIWNLLLAGAHCVHKKVSFGLTTVLLLVAGWVSGAWAHYPQGLSHLHSGNGLASNVVHHIVQDYKGYLWLGTETGVHRFDGRQVTRFISSDGLGGNEVFYIFEDSRRRLWFLTFNGVLSYFKDGQFHNPGNDPVLAQTRFKNMLTTIIEDDMGRIWAGSLDGTLYVIDDYSARLIPTPGSIGMRTGWQAEDGDIMIGTTSGIYRYDENNDSWRYSFNIPIQTLQRSYSTNSGWWFPYNNGIATGKYSDRIATIPAEVLGITSRVTAVALSADDTYLAVGSYSNGVFVYSNNNEADPELLYHFLPRETVTSVFFDNQNSLWIGTLNNGAYRLDESYTIVVNASLLEGMPDLATRTVYKDSRGAIWAGTLTGWVYRFHSADASPAAHRVRTTHHAQSIEKFLETSDGRLLVGTASGIHELIMRIDRNGNTVISDSLILHPRLFPQLTGTVKDMQELDGYLYVGSTTSFFRVRMDNWTEIEVLDSIRITSLAKSCDASLFAGSISGLYRLVDGMLEPVGAPELREIQIYDITPLYKDWLAIATYGNGLIFLNSNTGATVRMNRTRGLTDDLVRALYFESDGTLWVGTSLGLNRVRMDTTLDPADQLDELYASVTSYNESLFRTQIIDIVVTDALVWLAGSRDILLLERSYEGQPELRIPLFLEVVRINEQSVVHQSEWVVPHSWNRWHIRFTGILLRDNSRLMYRYRLRRPDQPGADWNITNSTEITFESIAPGSYIFEANAFSGDGKVSSETASISIKIQRPVWGHPLFWLAMIALTGGLATGLIRARMSYYRKQEFQQQQIRGRINELEHQALQAMMNPHFVFNILNSIRYQILRDEKHHASDMLLRFSKLIRLQLDSNYKREISLREELNRLELYVSLEAERLMRPIAFTYTFCSETDPSTTRIPSMIIQPFVENAVLHGIAPKDSEGAISVDVCREKDSRQLRIVIRDNGTGLKKVADAQASQSRRLSLGLKLVTERLELMSRQTGLPWNVDVADYIEDNGHVGGVAANVLFPIV
jgi:ligand-binding sensor domain-containing protein